MYGNVNNGHRCTCMYNTVFIAFTYRKRTTYSLWVHCHFHQFSFVLMVVMFKFQSTLKTSTFNSFRYCRCLVKQVRWRMATKRSLFSMLVDDWPRLFIATGWYTFLRTTTDVWTRSVSPLGCSTNVCVLINWTILTFHPSSQSCSKLCPDRTYRSLMTRLLEDAVIFSTSTMPVVFARRVLCVIACYRPPT